MKFVSIASAVAIIPMLAFAQTATPTDTTSPTAAGAASASSGTSTSAGNRERFRTACHADIEKFCVGVDRGRGKVRLCLESNKDNVTAGCKEVLAERAAKPNG